MSEFTTPSMPVQKTWKEQKEMLKVKYPTLTDEDLRYDNGKKEEMLTSVQNKLGITKDELQAVLVAV
jgi:uncharacterized protein YjbJ (UPF0337 family)